MHFFIDCKDRYGSCGDWITCCPGGDGSGARCSQQDCTSGDSICKGGWMKVNCPRTCDTCRGTVCFENTSKKYVWLNR